MRPTRPVVFYKLSERMQKILNEEWSLIEQVHDILSVIGILQKNHHISLCKISNCAICSAEQVLWEFWLKTLHKIGKLKVS